jgi:hypothetical protein
MKQKHHKGVFRSGQNFRSEQIVTVGVFSRAKAKFQARGEAEGLINLSITPSTQNDPILGQFLYYV